MQKIIERDAEPRSREGLAEQTTLEIHMPPIAMLDNYQPQSLSQIRRILERRERRSGLPQATSTTPTIQCSPDTVQCSASTDTVEE